MDLLMNFDILTYRMLYDIDGHIKYQLFTYGVENEGIDL